MSFEYLLKYYQELKTYFACNYKDLTKSEIEKFRLELLSVSQRIVDFYLTNRTLFDDPTIIGRQDHAFYVIDSNSSVLKKERNIVVR